jgi:Ca2+-binding EF-hand superfamily protein
MNVASRNGIRPKKKNVGLTFQNKIDEWIAATDFDSDGKITLEEFKLGMAGNSLGRFS